MNWLALGFPVACPAAGCTGAPQSFEQGRMLARMEAETSYFSGVPAFDLADLGRTLGKVEALDLAMRTLGEALEDVDLSFIG